MKVQKEKETTQKEIQDLGWNQIKLQLMSVLDKYVLENNKNKP